MTQPTPTDITGALREDRLTVDFCGALSLMGAGIRMRRLAWNKKRPIHHQKQGIQLTDDGKGIRTFFLNYYSDRSVFSIEDVLAKDWIEAR